jgi:ABC-2 type transport system permease protein
MSTRSASAESELRRPGGWLTTAAKTWAVLRITLASRFAYLGEIVMRTMFLVIIIFIFTQLWNATDTSTDGVQALTGFSVAQMIWYLVFSEAIVMSTSPAMLQEVDREVKSGDIAYRLARPLAYPLYHFGAVLGERLLRFGLNLLIGGIVALIVVGPISLAPLSVAAALTTAMFAFVVDFLISFTISTLSFWFEDTDGLHLLYSRSLMILGGLLIPLDAYPDWLGRIARALPFQYLLYQPARLFVAASPDGFLHIVGVQALLGVAVLAPMLLLYRLGLRRVAANGG